MYALDTNTLIYYFKGQGHVAKNLLAHSPKDIFVPRIVVYELEVGIQKSTQSKSRLQQFNHFIESFQIIDFGSDESRAAALIRSDLEKKGNPIGPLDTLIAGSALAHRLILVTHNTREFVKIKELKLEDWY